MVHGAMRRKRVLHDPGDTIALVDDRNGTPIETRPIVFRAYEIAEMYCAHCKAWETLAGVVSFLRPVCPVCHNSLKRQDVT
jgi:hypothetical protein